MLADEALARRAADLWGLGAAALEHLGHGASIVWRCGAGDDETYLRIGPVATTPIASSTRCRTTWRTCWRRCSGCAL